MNLSAAEAATPRTALVPLLDAVLRSEPLATGALSADDWASIQRLLRAAGWHTTAVGLDHRRSSKDD